MISAECGFDGNDAKDHLLVAGPTLKVNVVRLHVAAQGSAGSASINDVDALVDTGAIVCFIDEAVARTLGLLLVDRQTICGVGGLHEANVYLARVDVPALNFSLTGQFSGVDLIAGGQRHGVLLGRNLLSHFVMNYDGPSGRVTIKTPEQTTTSTRSA